MAGLRDLPLSLRIYLLAVIAAGFAMPAVAAWGWWQAPGVGWPALVLLLLMGAAAERFTLHLSHKTAINVSSGAYLAAVLVAPAAIPGLLALAAALLGQGSRNRKDPFELGFNVGMRGITFTAAAAIYAVAHRDLGWLKVAGFGSAWAILATAATAYIVGTALVAIVAGLQLASSPLRIVAATIRDDLVPEAAVAVLGLQLAYLVRTELILAPVVALPLVLVHLVFRDSVGLREDMERALADLVEVVELRDPYTAGHSRRVAEMARGLALELGLTHEEADVIASAGRVHDLGKVAIDPAVLMKPGRLTDEEMAEMQRHPALGADVIARFTAFGDGWRLVRHHHERWDGAGYPDKIGGEAVPFGARILAVADTFDALTTARPYREAKSQAFALEILTGGAGTQWDARVVAALLAILQRPTVDPLPVASVVVPTAAD